MNSILTSPEHQPNETKTAVGRWTKEEHQRFCEALKLYGKNWKLVEEYVGTRNGTQIRSHAQKFFNRLEREYNIKTEGARSQLKKKSLRKASENSISTTFSEPEMIPEPKSVVSNSPQLSCFESIDEFRRVPRKMSVDDVPMRILPNQTLFSIVMSKFNITDFGSLKLSDLVDLPTSSNSDNNTTSAFRPNPRKFSEDNVIIKSQLSTLKKHDLGEYELLAKKIKSSDEEDL